MNKLFRISNIIIFCAFLIFIQCTVDDKSTQASISTENKDEIIQLSNFLSQTLNTNLVNVTFNSKTKNFIIDGDIHVSLKNAKEHYEKSNFKLTNKTAQRNFNFLMSAINSSSIQLYMGPDVPSNWQIAINQSIINWNNINSNISITLISSPTPTSINVGIYYDPTTSTIAYADIPNANGNCGKYIQINTNFNYLTAAQKVFTITHEMGHNFGLAHTNVEQFNLIPCTPVSDPAGSIMNSIVGTWNYFSPYDNIAVSTLYPIGLGTKKLYRYQKISSSSSLYTTDPCEKGGGDNEYRFNLDACYLYATSISGTVPLYRSYKSNIDDFIYYTSTTPSSNRIEGYLYPTQQPGTTPLYCFETMDARLWRMYKQLAYHQYLSTTNQEVGNKKIIGYVVTK